MICSQSGFDLKQEFDIKFYLADEACKLHPVPAAGPAYLKFSRPCFKFSTFHLGDDRDGANLPGELGPEAISCDTTCLRNFTLIRCSLTIRWCACIQYLINPSGETKCLDGPITGLNELVYFKSVEKTSRAM